MEPVASSRWSLAVCALAMLTPGCGADVDPRAPSPSPSPHAIPILGVVPREPSNAALGTWYLSAGGSRFTVELARGAMGMTGALVDESSGARSTLVDVSWEPESSRLRFRYDRGGTHTRFDARAVEGVLVGRLARAASNAEPDALAYTTHVTGWNAAVFDRELVPRAFEIRVSNGARARVRVDRDASGRLVGTFKIYSVDGVGAQAEDLERDLEAVSWDGRALSFLVERDGFLWTYSGTVRGRSLQGTAEAHGGAGYATWTGTRAEVLSHGITSRSREALDAWRSSTRRALTHVAMAGAPEATGTRVQVTSGTAPTTASAPPTAISELTRPDASQGYTLSELRFEHTLADPRGGPDLTRRSHGYLAVPAGPAPPGGYTAVLAFNGHYAGARQVMTPGSSYWYGDAFARRGYLVLAIDVSHRPVNDRRDLYADFPNGDDATVGNGPHPAVTSAGFDTDWEEDGERVWDAMRALDYLRANFHVQPGRVVATGLSMGAEVATLFGAVDPRVDMVVSAGFSPDFTVVRARGNHPCWRWRYADIEEYLDLSDEHALIAPRMLVVESGRVDATFSYFAVPFASDKQVLRRSRAAFDDPRRLVHDLHDGAHVYHIGEPSVDLSEERGVSVPVLSAPDADNPLDWQTDGATTQWRSTVFDLTRFGWRR